MKHLLFFFLLGPLTCLGQSKRELKKQIHYLRDSLIDVQREADYLDGAFRDQQRRIEGLEKKVNGVSEQIGYPDFRIQMFNLLFDIGRQRRRIDSIINGSIPIVQIPDGKGIDSIPARYRWYEMIQGENLQMLYDKLSTPAVVYPLCFDSDLKEGYHWTYDGENLFQEADSNFLKPIWKTKGPVDTSDLHTGGWRLVDSMYNYNGGRQKTSTKKLIPKKGIQKDPHRKNIRKNIRACFYTPEQIKFWDEHYVNSSGDTVKFWPQPVKPKRKKKSTTTLCAPVQLIQDTAIFKYNRDKAPISH